MSAGYKYKKIAESLRQRIKNGGINTGELLPTTKKLATEFRTTPVTIDRAIGILVTEGLVSRTPGVGTQVLPAHGRAPGVPKASGLIGALLQAQTESRYWERLLEGVSDILRPQGLATLIGYHNQDHDTALEHAKLFKLQGVEIVLFAPFDRPSRELYEEDNAVLVQELTELGFQIIMLDRYIESVPGHFVSEYCYAQGKDMVEQMIDRGFNQPLCISTDYVSVIGSREQSFIDGCKSKSIPNAQDKIVRIPLATFQSRDYEAIVSQLLMYRGTNLFVCLNSRIFNTIIYLLVKQRLNGINPKGIKLCGFVDIELMDMDEVLGYVEQPVREMGHAAGRLVKQLLDGSSPEYRHSLVPCELRMLDDQYIESSKIH
jgi:DNA-binding LacI/PurR family transcriptional regulator